MSNIVRATLALVPACLLVLGPAVAASAHGAETVGELEMVIGFGTEPAYAGQPNSVQLILTRNGQPLTQLGDSLNVEVSFGDASTELPIVPNFEVGEFGEAGDYRAWFIPSEPGKYTFHFTGTVDGERVDTSMTSGPDTFSEVEDTSEASFPRVEAPTNDELATRIEQEAERARSGIEAATASAVDAASEATDAADSATTIAVVGLVVGAVGVAVGIAAIALSRRRS
jgi:hypothetical protein